MTTSLKVSFTYITYIRLIRRVIKGGKMKLFKEGCTTIDISTAPKSHNAL